jgi:glycosyltransferase involved in cell wall biosynthesis
MPVGLLPALGGGIRAMAETGQQSRLLDGYLRPYVRAFGDLFYFSYLPEAIEEFTSDPELLKHVHVLAPKRRMWRGRRAQQMTGTHEEQFNGCAALRVFQITGVIPALKAKSRFGVPYVTTYGFSYGQLSRSWTKSLLKRVLERRGLKSAAAVIATTEELRARAVAMAPNVRVELIPNGVDTTWFAPRPRGPERSRGNRKRILYVGRLSPEKNLGTIIMGSTTLIAADVMVGAGPLRNDLEAQAKRLGVTVEFPGVVDQRKLPQYYAEADVFVLASFTEGHPKALLEAMSCGLPCVVSDVPGNRSLVTDGETGLLFDPHSSDALRSRLQRVFADESFAAKLGRAARALVESRYDLNALVAREIDLVRSVAADRS